MILYGFAALSEDKLGKLQAFEKKRNKIALAVKSIELTAQVLSKEELAELEQLEKEIGEIVLVIK